MALRLRFPREFQGRSIRMEDGLTFKIFRQMRLKTRNQSAAGSILIVRFQFKRFGHKANMLLSRIPILLIAGFPGFRYKIWMIDWETDYWQGIYEFANTAAIDKYRKSFVLGMMNKRVIPVTISYQTLPEKDMI